MPSRDLAEAEAMRKPAILFVCLGNICRSPLAEAAFRRAASQAGLDVEIDSAGTGDWHLGYPPDSRAQAIARAKGIDISDLRARQVTPEDFERFDLLLALDHQNLNDLVAMRPPNARGRARLLLDMVPGREGETVHDPFYGTESDFEAAWDDVSEAAGALVRSLADQTSG